LLQSLPSGRGGHAVGQLGGDEGDPLEPHEPVAVHGGPLAPAQAGGGAAGRGGHAVGRLGDDEGDHLELHGPLAVHCGPLAPAEDGGGGPVTILDFPTLWAGDLAVGPDRLPLLRLDLLGEALGDPCLHVSPALPLLALFLPGLPPHSIAGGVFPPHLSSL
jgi:hypothetical protein